MPSNDTPQNELFHTKGEFQDNLPVWLGFLLALFGMVGCIVTAQLVIPKDLQSNMVLSRVSSFIEGNVKEELTPSSNHVDTIDKKELHHPLKAEPVETEQKTEIETSDQIMVEQDDCPPLFSFFFERNSLNPLVSEQNQKVDQLKDWLDLHPHLTLTLEGHSSSKGKKEDNLILSYRRAKAVFKFLTAAGIEAEQLSTQAFGEEYLLEGVPSTSEKNRRVSMRIKGATDCQKGQIINGSSN